MIDSHLYSANDTESNGNSPSFAGTFAQIPISLFETKRTNEVQADFVTVWPRFVEQLRGSTAVVYHSKNDAPLISPTCFMFNERLHAFATTAGVVMMDSDDGLTIVMAEEILRRLNVAAVIYTSARNRPENPRIRIVIPLAREVSPAAYRQVCRAMMRVIKKLLVRDYGIDWKFDGTKTHCGDLFYVPGTYLKGETDDGIPFRPVNDFRSLDDGEIWQPEEWVLLADEFAPIIIEQPRLAVKHNRDNDDNDEGCSQWSPWSADTHCRDKIEAYYSLSDGRQPALYGLIGSLACSAYYWRYDLSAGELADIISNIQRRNPPHQPYPESRLYQHASKAIASAPYYSSRARWPEAWEPMSHQLATMNHGAPTITRNTRLRVLRNHKTNDTTNTTGASW